MEIKIEKWITEDGNSYKILKIEKCCDKILKSSNITLNSEFSEDDTYEDEKGYSVKLIRKETDYEGYTDYFYETIRFCPFCGKSIGIQIVNEVDKTDEYKTLTNEREILWKKCCKTDSRKKEQELREKVRELDNKINKILEDDDLKEE